MQQTGTSSFHANARREPVQAHAGASRDGDKPLGRIVRDKPAEDAAVVSESLDVAVAGRGKNFVARQKQDAAPCRWERPGSAPRRPGPWDR